jgi:hypothetical protein
VNFENLQNEENENKDAASWEWRGLRLKIFEV